MIVRTEHDGVIPITQPDHAHLSGRIMEHCVPLRASPRRASILRAIREHDNGWTEEDAAPTIDPATGRIADFVNIPLHVRHGVWPRGVARLADDPWAAALVAQHAITVYGRGVEAVLRADGRHAERAGQGQRPTARRAARGLPLRSTW